VFSLVYCFSSPPSLKRCLSPPFFPSLQALRSFFFAFAPSPTLPLRFLHLHFYPTFPVTPPPFFPSYNPYQALLFIHVCHKPLSPTVPYVCPSPVCVHCPCISPPILSSFLRGIAKLGDLFSCTNFLFHHCPPVLPDSSL